MRTSVLWHLPSDRYVIFRESFLRICQGDQCAAALLSVFEYWTNYLCAAQEQTADENAARTTGGLEPIENPQWVYRSYDELLADTFGLFKRHQLPGALQRLQALGFLETRHNPRYPWDRTRQYRLNVEAINAALRRLMPTSAPATPIPAAQADADTVTETAEDEDPSFGFRTMHRSPVNDASSESRTMHRSPVNDQSFTGERSIKSNRIKRVNDDEDKGAGPQNDFARAVRVWEENMGVISPIMRDEMLAYWDELVALGQTNWWDMAIKVSRDAGTSAWSYTRKVLRTAIDSRTPPGTRRARNGDNGRKHGNGNGFAVVKRAETYGQHVPAGQELDALRSEWNS